MRKEVYLTEQDTIKLALFCLMSCVWENTHCWQWIKNEFSYKLSSLLALHILENWAFL